ncbi:MAG TPA: ATP-binding protein [Tepidisphaeraceae bacterium]|jgi:PAS domain S-box-containing protein|nr:ATP-binding protein [Tepidisphaeraceae bacterium]
MSLSNRRIGIRYGLAFVSVALVALLRWALQPALADAALILFVLPIVLSGWYGGIGPALLATVLATAAGAFLFMPAGRSSSQLGYNDFARVLVFFIVGVALSIFNDVLHGTHRQLALRNAEAQRQKKAAQRSKERLARVIDSAMDAIISVDGQRRIVVFNRAAEKLFGFSSTDALGKPIDQFIIDDFGLAGSAEGDVTASGTLRISRPTRAKTRRGDVIPVEAAVSQSADGENPLWTLIVRDVSERERVQRELEEANHAKDQFLAVLSHELRTPLTPVLASVAAMQEDPTIPAEARASLRIVRRNVELEARLIDDLLDLTRVSRGKLQMVSEVVAVHDLIRSAVETACQEEAQAKRLSIVLELDAEHDEVWGDPVRLQQVIWNLLRNAVKFTSPGGRIEVRSRNVDSLLVVDFIDNGMGIDQQALPRIFNAFEQTEEAVKKRFGGLGLGLAISKGLVEAQGGRLTAHSDGLGKGSRFTLEMILAEAGVGAKRQKASARRESAPAPLNILLVEDHEDTARIMSKLLRSFEHRVTWVANFATAVEAVEADHFDLLISDLGLPDGNGRDLMRQAKKKNSILGIALSGYGMESDVRASMEAGFAEHLTKPVNIVQLQEAIRRVTGN